MKVFKIGDKARVRKDLVGGKFYKSCTSETCYCVESMTNYAGSVVVVSEKDDMTGQMHLRKVEDGFTTEMPFSWSDGMLEPIEEEQPHGYLTVGSVVKIRSDIAKRVDSKNLIWITLNGKNLPSLPVSDEIKKSGGESVVITEVFPMPGHMDGCAYRARFSCYPRKNIACAFDIAMLDCLEDWLVKEKGNKHSDDNDKPKPSKNPKKKKTYPTADYSGYTPKSDFYCYDYLNRPATFSKNSMENITKIEVTVMSGDETGCFYGVCNGRPWQYRFDAAESRFASYDDGSYTVEGRENIEKWINWSYDPEKAIYAEYSMERMRAFKRC